MLTRREFLKIGAAAGASLTVPWGKLRFLSSISNPSHARANCSGPLTKFIQPMRMVGTDIPVAQPDTVNPGWWQPGVTHYTIDIGEYQDFLHPELPGTTTLRGFGQNGNFKHLGGVIAAKKGEPVQITFRNQLPNTYPLPVDETIMGVMGNQLNRIDVHLHGGFVPWISDGGPHAWWDPDGHIGPSFINNQVLRPGQIVPANEAEYYYPNQQSARLMWYHDHTFGLTRTNAYAGIASGYVIYDDYELALGSRGLPGPLDPRTIYLVFQDKVFITCDPGDFDSDWPVTSSKGGDLWYSHVYDGEVNPGAPNPLPGVSCVPEFFGDTILANGTSYPFLELEPRQYRLRILNACDARFLNPRLVRTQRYDSAIPDPTRSGPGFIQIGTEGGFLPNPVRVNGSNQPLLVMAPAERADLIVDFRGVPPNTTFILYNDAPAPYPMGDEANDYDPVSNTGPDTRSLLQIKIKPLRGAEDAPINLPDNFRPTDPFLIKQGVGIPTPIPAGVNVRYLTLNEDFDEYGRLIQQLGTNIQTGLNADGGPYFGKAYMDNVTEVVNHGSQEVWEILNLTGDTHPIHFHLVNGQVLSRQPFDAENYAGKKPAYTGPAYAPDKNELGWKETVRMNPGEVTRVLMKFDLPTLPFSVPFSPRKGIHGYEYVWHCHILEHEEHDMMRPLVVK